MRFCSFSGVSTLICATTAALAGCCCATDDTCYCHISGVDYENGGSYEFDATNSSLFSFVTSYSSIFISWLLCETDLT